MISAKYYQKFRQMRTMKMLKNLQETQFLPYQEVRSFQFNKLLKLLKHAFDNVPYYNRLFTTLGIKPEDIRNFDDYRHIPVLTKKIIRENFKDLVAKNMFKEELIENSTGGSTGQPLQFYQDQQFELWADAARIRGWYGMAGCDYGDTCAVLWGAMRDVKEDFSLYERLKDLLKYGEINLNAFNLSIERKRAFYKYCRILKPRLLRGYVSAVKDFAEFLDENSLQLPGLKGVILGAETVSVELQDYLESIFKTPSFNMYGGRELSLIAMECKDKNGLHEISENNYTEFNKIEISGYEDIGELIISNLNNYAMPFIRYKIGDLGVPEKQKSCTCGRGLPLIKKVIGRTTEVFEFYDGTRIAGEMFIHIMKEFPLKEYQFVQVSDKQIFLRIRKEDKISHELEKKIKNAYQKFIPENVNLSFETVDELNKTATGKFRFVLKENKSHTEELN